MAVIIYSLCALTAFLCSGMLFQAFMRSQYRLLLWGGICFAFLTLNNLLLVLDKLVLPTVDLATERQIAALVAMLILLYGLIWDKE